VSAPSPVLRLLLLLALGVSCRGEPEEPASGGAVQAHPALPGATAERLRSADGRLRRLGGSQAHRHPIDLAAGDFLHLVVEQRGIDVVVGVFGPGPRHVFDVDSPTGNQSDEHVVLLAGRTGRYWIEVRPFDPSAAEGGYRLRIAALRRAGRQDRLLAQAEAAFATARSLEDRSRGSFSPGAADLYREAAHGFQEVDDGPRQADALIRLARMERAAGRLREAIRLFRQALPLRPLRLVPGERAVLQTDLGAAYRDLGEMGAAKECFEEAARLHGRASFPQGKANALLNLGALEEEEGLTLDALGHLEEARSCLRGGQGFHSTEVMILNEIGSLYTALSATDQAIEHHRQALALLDLRRDPGLWADTLGYMGHAFLEADDLGSATGAYEQALELQKRQTDPRGEAAALGGLGLVAERRGETAQAQALYQRALRIFEEQGDLLAAGVLRNNLGWLHLRAGQPDRAMDLFQQALDGSQGLRGSSLRAAALFGMARVERQRGHLEAAGVRIRSALSLIETVRQGMPRSDLRASYLASRQDDYAFLVELLMEQHRRQPGAGYDALALGVSEQSRARQLLDVLAGGEVRPPGLWEAGSRAARPSTLQEIQQQVLDRDTALLEIHLGSPQSFLWLVTQDSLRSYPLPDRAILEASARQAYERLAESHRPTATAAARLAAADLSWKLLGPAAPLPAERRLIVVTSGALQYIPFAGLPEPSPQGPDATAPPLVAGHEIVHLPSASALAILQRQASTRKLQPRLLAVVADPVFRRDDERFARRPGPAVERPALWDVGLPQLERLPYVQQEARAILSLAADRPARAFLGFAASRELVLSGELAHYRILHFATHGWFDPRHPELSALLLSRFDAAGRPRDGRLRMREIYGLTLPADLVVLSGCQTALGREIQGEGLVGLTRGFLYAGARSVMVSVWNVGDRSTAELMERFYRGLLVDGLPAAAALRQAQISMWRDATWSPPFYWAGFEIQGDGTTRLPPPARARPGL